MDRKLFKVLAREEEEEEEDNGVKIMLFRFNMYMYIHDEIDSYLHVHCRIEDIDIEINTIYTNDPNASVNMPVALAQLLYFFQLLCLYICFGEMYVSRN